MPAGPCGGDVIAAPAGGPKTAHQLTAAPDCGLRYLAVSTRLAADIIEYPDSGKLGVFAAIPDGKGAMSAGFRRLIRAGDDLDYWDGETEAP